MSPAERATSLEGRIVTGKRLRKYETILGIHPQLLEGGTVLNFGAGASHIGKELAEKGITCRVVDVDIKYDPTGFSINIFKDILTGGLDTYLKYSHSQSQRREKLVNLRKRLTGMEGRNFIQADGRKLPFPDNAFDFVLAQWSTYQVPSDAKETVFSELMRVGQSLHIAPIVGKDFAILERLAKEKKFDIIACQPLWGYSSAPPPFTFSSPFDYSEYTREYEASRRIIQPAYVNPQIIAVGNCILDALITKGSRIVLRRRV